MSEGLDLIARQQPEIIGGFPTGNIYIGVTKEELTELEKELKESEKNKQVLEIIKKKNVLILAVKKASSFEEYNRWYEYSEEYPPLTEIEFNLIKEWLEK